MIQKRSIIFNFIEYFTHKDLLQLFTFRANTLKATFYSVKIFARDEFLELKILRGKI